MMLNMFLMIDYEMYICDYEMHLIMWAYLRGLSILELGLARLVPGMVIRHWDKQRSIQIMHATCTAIYMIRILHWLLQSYISTWFVLYIGCYNSFHIQSIIQTNTNKNNQKFYIDGDIIWNLHHNLYFINDHKIT